MKTTRHGATPCPRCRQMLDASTVFPSDDPDAVPAPGDYSVCVYCGAVLRFNVDMSVRLAKLEDLEALDDDDRINIAHAQRVIARMPPD